MGESLGLREVLWDVNKGIRRRPARQRFPIAVLAAVRPGSVVVLHGPGAPYTALSVDGQRGVLSLSAGQTRQVFLSSVSKADTDTTATVRLGAAPGGSGAYASLVARRVAPTVEYRGTARVRTSGAVSVIIYRMNGSQPETIIGQEVFSFGFVRAAGVNALAPVESDRCQSHNA